jgi:hypothetical protein
MQVPEASILSGERVSQWENQYQQANHLDEQVHLVLYVIR